MDQSYYEWLVDNDIYEWCRSLFEQKGWSWSDVDGRIYNPARRNLVETPWHFVATDYRLKCGLWHHIMFDLIGESINGKRFVPSKCQQCFKVVVRPQTLRQLFALESVQKRLNVPSKCGIEVRQSVHGLYGGYFYNVGLEGGLARFHQVREAVSANEALGPDVNVFLKRGCTEFEHAVGDSDKWEVTPEQLRIEALIEQWVVWETAQVKQPEPLVNHVHRRWIEYAYANNDPTYAEFTGGKPLYAPYKLYNHLAVQDGEVVVAEQEK